MKTKKALLVPLFLSIVFVLSGCQSSGNANSNNLKALGSVQVSKEKDEEIEGLGISRSYNLAKAITEGNVVVVSLINDKGSETKQEVYNINIIDQFVDNFNDLRKDKVRIIKYVKQEDKLWINKMSDMEYDGQKITYKSYDTYEKEKQSKNSFDKIVKTQSSNGIRYALIENKNTSNDEGLTVISFLGSNIKN
jgi:hypothetical protein